MIIAKAAEVSLVVSAAFLAIWPDIVGECKPVRRSLTLSTIRRIFSMFHSGPIPGEKEMQ